MTGWLAPVGLRLLLHDTGAKEVDPELASHGGGWGVTGPSWLDSWSSLIADSSRGSCAVRAAAPWHPLSQPATAGVAEGREEVGATHLHQGEGTDLPLRFYELWISPKYPACVNLVTQFSLISRWRPRCCSGWRLTERAIWMEEGTSGGQQGLLIDLSHCGCHGNTGAGGLLMIIHRIAMVGDNSHLLSSSFVDLQLYSMYLGHNFASSHVDQVHLNCYVKVICCTHCNLLFNFSRNTQRAT